MNTCDLINKYYKHMKGVYLIIILLLSNLVFSQEQLNTDKNTAEDVLKTATDSTLISSKDSTFVSEKNRFIKDYTNRFNVKLEMSNSVPQLYIPFKETDKYVQIEPNLGTKYAFVFSYKFLSLRLGVRSKGSKESIENKGKPKSFRLNFKLLFNRWQHQFEYNQIKGYYVSKSSEPTSVDDSAPHIQFPNLTTKTFNGITSFKLNDNYSARATISQTEKQIKSAGSFIPSIHYSIYDISGTQQYIGFDGIPVDRNSYYDTFGFITTINAGYHYTFIYKDWFLNGFVIPGIGADFNKITSHTPTESSTANYIDFIFTVQSSVGFGYNTNNLFLGGFIGRTTKKQKNNASKTQFNTSQNAFSVYIGYRFKAPKTIAKPINHLEEKLPFN